MKLIESKLPFNYKTIRVTRSRIKKGLLAIPVSLIKFFPKQNTKINVYCGTSGSKMEKNFTAYSSSSKECRIGGMHNFYKSCQVKDGDELVIQLLGDKQYKILTEVDFINNVIKLENEFDNSMSDDEAKNKLDEISKITDSESDNAAFSEYVRLSALAIEKRGHYQATRRRAKENVRPAIRELLSRIYKGKCQVTGFSFLMKNGNPYFEVHHIQPDLGDHLKNLLVVCPNVHAQFTCAFVEEYYNKEGWLNKVKFNGEEFIVEHIYDKIPKKYIKEVHFDAGA